MTIGTMATHFSEQLNAIRANALESSAVRDEILSEQLRSIHGQLSELRQAVADVRLVVGPFGVRISDDQMLVQTIYGIKYLIDPHDLIMTPQLIVYRQWESELSRFFFARAKADTLFLDIGANFGYFTCLVASRIGTSGAGRVYAFEPNPGLVRLLRANTTINWSMSPIEVLPIALGAKESMVQLCVPSDRAANGSLTASVDSTDRIVDVPMNRLDDTIPAGTQVNLIKLDVEGHEYGVLAGATRVIGESPAIEIVMEWSSQQMMDAGVSIQSMLELIDSLGLKMMKIPEQTGSGYFDDYPINNLNENSYDNVLLVRR